MLQLIPSLTSRPGVGMTASVCQYQVLDFVQLYISHPVLIVVESGEKLVRWGDGEVLVRSGEAIALAGKQTLDITNRLPVQGLYRAYWLVWDDALLTRFAGMQASNRSVVKAAKHLGQLAGEARASCERALLAVRDDALPLVVAQHRLTEVLWWMHSMGVQLLPSVSQSVTERVRSLIASSPADDWTGPRMASDLAMSEATLRRKLAGEGTSFSDLLLDVRMSFAAQMLQCTDYPIIRIAQDVGYDSPSHFTQRFRQRFGFLPSAIREAASNAEV